MTETKYLIPWKKFNNNDYWIKIISNETETNLEIYNEGIPIQSIGIDSGIFFGSYPLVSKNLLIISYYKQIEDEAFVLIDIYQINESETESGLDIQIQKINQHKIKSSYPFETISGKLLYRGGGLFYLIFGDVSTYEFFSVIEFDLEKYAQLGQIMFESTIEPEFDLIYLLDKDNMIWSKTLAHDLNIIELGLFDAIKSKCFSLTTIELPDGITHAGKKTLDSKCETFESIIYDFFNLKVLSSEDIHQTYCLVRIKLFNKINGTEHQYYFLDFVVEVGKPESKVIVMSEPVYFEKDLNRPGYFGLRPYYEIYNDGENKIIKIFNENNIKN